MNYFFQLEKSIYLGWRNKSRIDYGKGKNTFGISLECDF